MNTRHFLREIKYKINNCFIIIQNKNYKNILDNFERAPSTPGERNEGKRREGERGGRGYDNEDDRERCGNRGVYGRVN